MSQITHGLRAILSHPKIYDAFQNIMGAKQIRQELVSDFIRPCAGEKILDVGCGTAEILAFFSAEVSYFGYDPSPEYIAAAEKRYGSRAKFICGLLNDDELKKLPPMDIVLAIGVLHHLDDNSALDFFRLAKSSLRQGGRIITIDPCFSDTQNPLARFLVSKDRGMCVRNSDGYLHLASRENFRSVEGTLRHRVWVPYTHWIMQCTI